MANRPKKDSTCAGRKSAIVEAKRAALRDTLQVGYYLKQIHATLEKDYLADRDSAEIAIKEANMKLGGYFKILNKVLPDLKAVELTGADGGPVTITDKPLSKEEWVKQYGD